MNDFRDAITSGRVASGPANQRSEHRQILTAEEARLFVGRRSYVVDLLNLSGGGAMIRTNLPLKLWQRVHLELGGSDCVECAVRWIKEDRVGVEFAHETQVAGDARKRDAMLLDTIARNFPEIAAEATNQMLPGDDQRRAELRHPLIWWGEICFNQHATRVRLRNISEHGAMVDCPMSFPDGADVLLDIGGGGQHSAIVSWSRGDQLGLRFQHPFEIDCLARAAPEVAPQSWTRPDYFNAGQGADSPWAEPWERLSVLELRTTLEGFSKL